MRFFLGLLVFVFCQCTGINLRTSAIPHSPNTHPFPEYAEPDLLYRGGYFYHSASNIIFSGPARIERKGRACSHSFLYLLALGDSKIDSAKVNGGISEPALIEQEIVAFLGFFYHRHCTIVLGESF